MYSAIINLLNYDESIDDYLIKKRYPIEILLISLQMINVDDIIILINKDNECYLEKIEKYNFTVIHDIKNIKYNSTGLIINSKTPLIKLELLSNCFKLCPKNEIKSFDSLCDKKIFELKNSNDIKELENMYSEKFVIENIFDNEDNFTNNNIQNLCSVFNNLSPTNIPNTQHDINEILEFLLNTQNNNTNSHHIIIAKYENIIIGAGIVIIEQKILRNLSKVGHIEDIVICSKFRKLGLAKNILNQLIEICKKYKCYKVLLDCSQNVQGLYEKMNFQHKANTMRLDIKN
jgi:glucosamine-phosphate N-acetyltransferase